MSHSIILHLGANMLLIPALCIFLCKSAVYVCAQQSVHVANPTRYFGKFTAYQQAGLIPKENLWILDIGAHNGQWSRDMSQSSIFSGANFFHIEANTAHEELLKQTGHPYAIALVGDVDNKEINYFTADPAVAATDTGNSIFRENTVYFQNHGTVRMPMYTVDTILQSAGIVNTISFQIAKLDVQGAEVLALKGMSKFLKRDEPLVITEVSVVPYNDGAPSFFEVHVAMEALGYVFFDILEEHHYFLSSGERMLLQMDVVWAPRGRAVFNNSHTWPDKQWSCHSRL